MRSRERLIEVLRIEVERGLHVRTGSLAPPAVFHAVAEVLAEGSSADTETFQWLEELKAGEHQGEKASSSDHIREIAAEALHYLQEDANG